MTQQTPSPSRYRIEISGWDSDENFFVEKTELDWSETHFKRVNVRHLLSKDAVVFVRLMHPTSLAPSFPIAYKVESVTPPDASGTWELQLVQLHPRPPALRTQSQIPEAALEGKQG